MVDYHKYCEQKAYKSGSSFYYSVLFMEQKQKEALYAIYAFCREVDDCVDECTDKNVAFKKLEYWQNEINNLFAEKPSHPITMALNDVLKNYNLQKLCFDEMIAGMHMDLNFQGYEKFSDLKVYCHCVASTVGLMAAEVFGYKDLKTLEYAKNLGIALQLVNIIRDVGVDARLGRIYIPEEDIQKFHITPDDILNNRFSDNFQALMVYEAKRARDYFKEAMRILPTVDRYKQKTGIIMAKIYFTILDEIEKSGFHVLDKKISITPIKKLWTAIRANSEEKKCKRQTAMLVANL